MLTLAVALVAPATAHAAVKNIAPAAGIGMTAQSWDVAVADYNADGYPDFLYSPQNGSARQLWRANGDGTYAMSHSLAGTVTTDQHGCAWADVNLDGALDVYCTLGAIGGNRSKHNSLWLQGPGDTFTDAGQWAGVDDPIGRGRNATFLDANGDSYPDLYVTNYAAPRTDGLPAPNRLYTNLGADPVTGQWLGYQPAPEMGLDQNQGERGCTYAAQFPGDAQDDIVFCASNSIHLYSHTDAGYIETTLQQLGGNGKWGAAGTELADITGDGIRDLVYVRLSQFGVRAGRAGGTFAPPTMIRALTAGRDIAVADVDGNGTQDVYVLQGNGQPGCTTCATNHPDMLLMNTAGKLAPTAIPQTKLGSGDQAVAIDTDLDGRSEVMVTNGANLKKGPVMLLRWTA
ncbi:MAG: hypothetical protein QOJ13_2456 [Gaiellales bacterium]|jgi:hypothetical protein|nr:hypothetical protein [Gaiellales bacterium]